MPMRGSDRLSRWKGTFVDGDRPAQRPSQSLPERGAPGRGGTGLISSLFLGNGSQGRSGQRLRRPWRFQGARRWTMRCLSWSWSFRLRRRVTNARGALTLPARRCGAPRFASTSSFFGLRHHPFPQKLSVYEHVAFAGQGCAVAWRRAAPRVQAAPQADWMDEEAWQDSPRSCHGKQGHIKKASRFLPRAWLKTVFPQWRCAMWPDIEERRLELWRDSKGLARLNLQIGWCRYGMHGSSGESRPAMPPGRRNSVGWRSQADWAVTWSARAQAETGDWKLRPFRYARR